MGRYRNHYDAKPLPGDNHRMTERAEWIRDLLETYRILRLTHLIEFLKYYFKEYLNEQTTARYLRWLMDQKEVIRIRRDPESKTVPKGSLAKLYALNTPRNGYPLKAGHLYTTMVSGF